MSKSNSSQLSHTQDEIARDPPVISAASEKNADLLEVGHSELPRSRRFDWLQLHHFIDLDLFGANRPLPPVQSLGSSFISPGGTSSAIQQQPQGDAYFCQFCNDHPVGFENIREVRRHIDSDHRQLRQVFICRDVSEDGTFLAECKPCQTNKTYKANYRAGERLRNIHFNPRVNGQGGKGSGPYPAMQVLREWIYEAYEMAIDGRVVAQEFMPEIDPSSCPERSFFNPDLDRRTSPYDIDSTIVVTWSNMLPISGITPRRSSLYRSTNTHDLPRTEKPPHQLPENLVL